jgi:hypothetical protein
MASEKLPHPERDPKRREGEQSKAASPLLQLYNTRSLGDSGD